MMPHTPQSTQSPQEEQDRIQEREEFDRAEYALEVRISDLEHYRCMLRDIRTHRGL